MGHDGVNTRAKACRSAVLFLLRHSGGGGGGGEREDEGGGGGDMGWREGGKRKWHENVASALFMDPAEEREQRLGPRAHRLHMHISNLYTFEKCLLTWYIPELETRKRELYFCIWI